jgi:hypothetical protein
LVVPFHVAYTLGRRQRVGELLPWLPALAGSLGFGIGGTYLSATVTPWFLLLFLPPVLFYRGLFGLLFDLAVRPAKPVELTVDEFTLWVRTGDERRTLPLAGIIQVFRTDDGWTVLHRDNSTLLVPEGVLTDPQLDYLKCFARRALAERRAVERAP